jgi:hypothetical protein
MENGIGEVGNEIRPDFYQSVQESTFTPTKINITVTVASTRTVPAAHPTEMRIVFVELVAAKLGT